MKKYLFLGLLTVVFVSIGAMSVRSQSGSTHDLRGWAWSSNTGWISVNCLDGGNCSTSNYKVQVDASGNLTGYAWSSNAGWIKFGGLSSIPAGGSNAHVNITTDPNMGAVTGWVRACAGTVKAGDSSTQPTQKGDCSTMTSRPDGWDGWIELSGTNHTSPDGGTINIGGVTFKKGGVTYFPSSTDGLFKGFAWGSNIIGWINFEPRFAQGIIVTCPGCVTPVANPLVGSCSITASTGTFTSNSATISPGGSVTFQASPTGGLAPYTYSWIPESTAVSGPSTLTHIYASSGNYSPSVAVTDTSSPPQNITLPCGSVTVSISGGPFPLGGSCTVPSTATIPNGQSTVTISPTLSGSGGTSPYDFNPTSFTLPAGTYSGANVLQVVVTDSTNNTATIICNDIVVNGGTTPVSDCSQPLHSSQCYLDQSLYIGVPNTTTHLYTNSLACPSTPPAGEYCQYSCVTGFRVQGGVCVSSTIRER